MGTRTWEGPPLTDVRLECARDYMCANCNEESWNWQTNPQTGVFEERCDRCGAVAALVEVDVEATS